MAEERAASGVTRRAPITQRMVAVVPDDDAAGSPVATGAVASLHTTDEMQDEEGSGVVSHAARRRSGSRSGRRRTTGDGTSAASGGVTSVPGGEFACGNACRQKLDQVELLLCEHSSAHALSWSHAKLFTRPLMTLLRSGPACRRQQRQHCCAHGRGSPISSWLACTAPSTQPQSRPGAPTYARPSTRAAHSPRRSTNCCYCCRCSYSCATAGSRAAPAAGPAGKAGALTAAQGAAGQQGGRGAPCAETAPACLPACDEHGRPDGLQPSSAEGVKC